MYVYIYIDVLISIFSDIGVSSCILVTNKVIFLKDWNDFSTIGRILEIYCLHDQKVLIQPTKTGCSDLI